MSEHQLIFAGLAFLVLIGLWNAIFVYLIRKRVRQIGDHRPVEPTPELIKYWRRCMEKYEKGSAKWKAYRKRLIDWGDDIDGD